MSATLVVALAGAPCASAQPAAPPFESCAPEGPDWAYEDLLCVYQTGARERRLAEAREWLRALGGGAADRPWPTLVLAHTTLNDDAAAAIRLYETAAAGFVSAGVAEGEVIARQNLRLLFHRRGDLSQAARQVELAVAAANASNQPMTIARASVLEAAHLIETGGNMGRAQRALQRAERLAFPGAPIALRRAILLQLGNVNFYLGLLDEAIDALERHRALRLEDGATTDATAVAFNLLNAHVTRAEARPLAGERARLAEMATTVLAEIQALDRPLVEAHAHRMLGDLLRTDDPAQALSHLRRCLDIERPLGYPDLRATCLWSLSLHLARRDAAEAERLSQEAIALVSAEPGGPLLAFAWQARLRLVWDALGEAEAITESFEALEAIERLRAAQPDESSRAALFGNWTRDYYWLTGRLLERGSPRADQAFEVGERLRARVLLDRLARAGVPAKSDGASERAAAAGLDRRIADVQRGLLTAPPGSGRRTLLDRLALLELERREATEGDAPAADESALEFASLRDVRQALGPGEAMVWYSLAPWTDLYGDFGGGAWVLAITRDDVTSHRLDVSVELDQQVAAFAGLLRQRGLPATAWTPAAQALGQRLLAPALASLPASVERLAIVSDGPLHQLPFEALRPFEDATLAGERFDLVTVPSATLWLRLRGLERPVETTALVLADPELPRGRPDEDLRLAPLPGARREARAIRAALDLDDDLVREGAEASEHAIKQAPLTGFRVVHLAAHARADARFPERSAVFLSPGADEEDGWLQPPEIVSLGLRGALIVLSACESAQGALVPGEGVLSLARAFFAGGAGSVIATRWPLTDDDAAFMMERFYRSLARGATIAAAMRLARMEAIAAGLPPEAWAGVALLGDGSRAVGQAPPVSWPGLWWWLSVPMLIVAAWLARRRYRRT